MNKAIFLLLLVSCFTFSQNKQLLYGFSDIPQSLMLNPGGEVKNDWYVGIPLLSHFHFNVGSSGSTVYDVLADDGIDFNTKLKKAIYSMEAHDFFTIHEQLDIFSGGFAYGRGYEKNKYISFGLYQEFDFISYFPKDLAVLAYEGNHNNINRPFDVGDLNISGEVLSVFHVGFNKKVNKLFSYGFRGKIYSSIANLNSTNNNGSFITKPGDNNYYTHVFDLDMAVRTSGVASLLDDENSDIKNDLSTLRNRFLLGGNLGLGFDVGFTYQLTEQWSVDASLLDIGFVRHGKDVKNYEIEGIKTFEGIDPLFHENDNNQTADEIWNQIEEDFGEYFKMDTTTTKYTTWRPVKLNASVNYSFGKKKYKDCNCLRMDEGYQNAVGGQLYAIRRPKGPQVALTAYYYRRLFNGLSAKATYTVDSYSFKNIGLGLSAHLGGFNIYMMADNFLEYQNVYNAQSVSLQLGFNYIFKKNED